MDIGVIMEIEARAAALDGSTTSRCCACLRTPPPPM